MRPAAVNITKAQAAQLGRRAAQPKREPGELLAVFVEGKLRNPLNGLRHWRSESRYRKGWHERVAQALFEAGWSDVAIQSVRGEPTLVERDAAQPKRVAFLANTGGRMDTDGLQAALKPVRDALVECGVLSGDAERDGHEFVYEQRIDRKRRGVEIRVRLRADGLPRRTALPTSVAERTRR